MVHPSAAYERSTLSSLWHGTSRPRHESCSRWRSRIESISPDLRLVLIFEFAMQHDHVDSSSNLFHQTNSTSVMVKSGLTHGVVNNELRSMQIRGRCKFYGSVSTKSLRQSRFYFFWFFSSVRKTSIRRLSQPL